MVDEQNIFRLCWVPKRSFRDPKRSWRGLQLPSGSEVFVSEPEMVVSGPAILGLETRNDRSRARSGRKRFLLINVWVKPFRMLQATTQLVLLLYLTEKIFCLLLGAITLALAWVTVVTFLTNRYCSSNVASMFVACVHICVRSYACMCMYIRRYGRIRLCIREHAREYA